MLPLIPLILIGAGIALIANELQGKGKTNAGTIENGSNRDNRRINSKPDSGRRKSDRPRRLKEGAKNDVSDKRNIDKDGDRNGNDHDSKQSSGTEPDRKTKGVKPEKKEAKKNAKSEKHSNNGGGDDGGDVRTQSNSGNEPTSTETD